MIRPSIRLCLLLASLPLLAADDPHASAPTERLQPQFREKGGTVSIGTHAAWKMTDEERITRRAGVIAGVAGRSKTLNAREGYRESINGRLHPELMLPYELFDRLLYGIGSDAKRSANAHALYDEGIAALGLDVDEFWTNLRSSSGGYLTMRERNGTPAGTEFVSSSGKRLFVPISRDACGARISSLQAARRLCGGDTLDRVLYSVVAPEAGHSSSGTSSPADRVEQLKFLSGGCK